jgi:hypothetical protein
MMTELQLVSKNPIVKKIAEGEAKEDVLEMLLAKQLPFTEEELLESLVFTMRREAFQNQSLERLKEIKDSTKISYVEKREANHRVAYYVLLEAINWKKHPVVTKVVHNQAFPEEFLMKIAEKGDENMLELLLDNQIKMIAYPEIMEEMEKNPAVTNFILGRIQELREYYLIDEKAEEIPAEEVLDDVKEVLALEQEQAKEQVSQDDREEGEEDEDLEEDDIDSLEDIDDMEVQAMTTLQEINSMNISERVKLAMSGSKTHRMILIKDPNKMVSMAVMESPKLSLDEVAVMSKNKSLPGELVAKIANKREWTKNYPIMLELVRHPKTPVKQALSFVKKLHYRDLRQLTRNKNVSPVVRTLALNYFTQKSGLGKK